MTRPGRVPCSIIGCKRTASKDFAGDALEVICGPHWRLAPLALRKVHAAAKRAYLAARAKLGGVAPADAPADLVQQLVRADFEEGAAWDAVRDSIIEAVVGIA